VDESWNNVAVLNAMDEIIDLRSDGMSELESE
jgi:hypothetical protein